MGTLRQGRRWIVACATFLAVIGGGYATVAAVGTAAGDTATVGQTEAETFTSVQGYGTSVNSSSTASGGKYLTVDSNVMVTGKVTTTGAATAFNVQAKTDSGVTAAKAAVTVDGVSLGTLTVPSATWSTYSFAGNWAAGTHTVKIAFQNAAARNLYLDFVSFASSTTPTPTPTPTPPPSGTEITAYLTGYDYYDNTPPGSAAVSNPVIHQTAGGTGTYTDPITLAVGHTITSSGQDVLDWPAGTKFYVPNLRKYFIVEDTCGDGNTPQNGPCHTGYPAPATTWLDLWVDGQTDTSTQASNCMDAITGVHKVIKDPPSTYAVVPGAVAANGGCATQYGDTVVLA
ncbi:MAG: hypothetical protein QOE53_2633 [Pseudonocardiales bacterium]|jgi:hypothetical protein|nr:hypothetical protein [Pseudonocardiales bacterium]